MYHRSLNGTPRRTSHRSSHRLLLIWAAGAGPILAAMLATAAPTLAAPAERVANDPLTQLPAQKQGDLRDVPSPSGVDAAALTPPTGAAVTKLRQPLEEIIKQFPERPAAAVKPAAQNDEEPVLSAQIAYARGREAWHERRGTDALQYLQAAQRLAPNEPTIARLLGQIYGALGNRGQAAMFLEHAVRLDPQHVQTLFMLGGLYGEQGNTSRAIPLLVAALDALSNDASVDPSFEPVIRFALARALGDAGYAAAAIAQFEAVYSKPLEPGQSTQLGRQLYEIDQARAETWMRIGDAYHRLGQPRDALTAYQTAIDDDKSARTKLLARLLYTQLRLGNDAQAQQAVLHELRTGGATADNLAGVRYLAEHSRHAEGMTKQLRAIYDADPDNEQLALAMVALLSDDEGLALLREQVIRHPDNLQVYQQIVDRSLDGPAAGKASHTALVQLAAKLIDAHPLRATDYQLEPKSAEDRQALLTAIDSLKDAERSKPVVQYLRAILLTLLDCDDDAIASLRLAAADDRLQAAKVGLTRLLVANERFAEASEYLDGLANATDPDIVQLRAQVLARSGQMDKAIALLDDLIRRRPNDSVDLVLEKANLLAGTNDLANLQLAEAAMLESLDTNPDSELLFRALFRLYESPPGAAVPDVVAKREKLLRRLFNTIPDSRLGRIKRAQLALRSNDAATVRQAEMLLRGLIAENAEDYEAFSTWMTLMVITDRLAQATEALEARLREKPDDMGLLTAAQSFYRGIGDQAKLYEVTEHILILSEPSLTRTTLLAEIYIRTEKYEKALPLLTELLQDEQLEDARPYLYRLSQALAALDRAGDFEPAVEAAIKRFPDQKLELKLLLASHYSRAGNRDRAEQIKVDILKDDPTHAPTNNDLGYTWADRGERLDEAERMIRIAVEAEPDNMAYLDSLGWVLYKQGKFGEAIVWLRRSVEAAEKELRAGNAGVLGTLAVVTDHLADATYRNNEPAAAQELWRRALEFHMKIREKDDPELETLDDRLRLKIEAQSKGQPVPAAAVPSLDKPGTPAIEAVDSAPPAPR